MKHLLLTTITAVVLVGCGGPSGIHKAASNGNIDAVKQHLAAGTDIELKCTGCGGTALGHAAKHGHKEIVELLIAEGAGVNAKKKGESTPLHNAAWGGNKEIIELLIANGADIMILSSIFAACDGEATSIEVGVLPSQVDCLI